MAYESKCTRCGGTNIEPGVMQSTGRIYFRPGNTKFLTFKTGDVDINANACADCGHVDLVADVKKLASLTERVRPI